MRRMKSVVTRPTRVVPLAFLAAMAIGTILLMLPIARAGPGGAPFLTALFTATSAVCVTGLIVVDTPSYWTGFGEAVILLLFQIGGFGIMAAATLLGLLAGRGFRLRDRLVTDVERSRLDRADAASVLRMVLGVTLLVEGALALWLALRLHLGHGEPLGTALWNGVFHSVSAFNNAGFSTYSDSLIGLQTDWLFLVPIMVAIIVSGLGFPVLRDLWANRREPARWTLHTKITLMGTVILLLGGFVWITASEWGNPATFGPMAWGDKLLNGMFHSVVTRTAGFNAIDVSAIRSETVLANYVLMFIGGGSAGTAGGIKITTFFLLGIVVWSEIRGQRDAVIFGRRVGSHVERQALTVILLALTLIGVATAILLGTTTHGLDTVLFEVISAFATVGLSMGITASLPPSGELVLIVLMFVGRVGTITVATGLALGQVRNHIRYPQEQPIVG